MTRKLHVDRLAFTVEHDDLARLFGRYGTVRSAEVLSVRGRKVGLVEMGSDAEAGTALAALDGHPYIGYVLAVQWADPSGTNLGEPAQHARRRPQPRGDGEPMPGGFGDRGGEGFGGAQFYVSDEPLDRAPQAPLIARDWDLFEPVVFDAHAWRLAPLGTSNEPRAIRAGP